MKKVLVLFVISLALLSKPVFSEDDYSFLVIKIDNEIKELDGARKILTSLYYSTESMIQDQKKLEKYYGAWNKGSIGVAVVASLFIGISPAIVGVAGAEVAAGCFLTIATLPASIIANEILDNYWGYIDEKTVDGIKKIREEYNIISNRFKNAHLQIDLELEKILADIPDWGMFGWNEQAYVVAQIEALEAHKHLYKVEFKIIEGIIEKLKNRKNVILRENKDKAAVDTVENIYESLGNQEMTDYIYGITLR
ncbi:MAG: hypothetical protein A3F16_06470 [Deltaproteobacteria bacterium RIFCSPHIGHO2_12_FULL_43_9]|nr:MAG: hypothetical protein A3F16_06470 [Deltaproteobacteria bacterium RIFCSPHIGHO2_12_FULL_43_9]